MLVLLEILGALIFVVALAIGLYKILDHQWRNDRSDE